MNNHSTVCYYSAATMLCEMSLFRSVYADFTDELCKRGIQFQKKEILLNLKPF